MDNEIKVSLQPVQTTRASEEIYEQIRQLILNGEILPGEHLPSERKMMEMMQRSRPTIREAMRMLERDGYIRTQSGSSGAVVQEMGLDNAVQSLEDVISFRKLTIEDILEFRQMMECYASGFVAERRTEEDLAGLKSILEEGELCIGSPVEFIRCDLEFHLALAEATGNNMYPIMLQVCRGPLEEALTAVLDAGSAGQIHERYARIQNDHQAIFDAILQQDRDNSRSAMADHLRNAADDILMVRKEK